VGLGEQAAGPVERIALAAPVPQGVVLHSAAALVQLGIRQLAHVERVSDLGDVAEAVVEHLAVGAGQVEHTPADLVLPRLGLLVEPVEHLRRGPPRDDVDELRGLAGPPTFTTEVHHCWRRHCPVRQNRVSSKPTASTAPTRSTSASSSASP
jgi:hypothetical protein